MPGSLLAGLPTGLDVRLLDAHDPRGWASPPSGAPGAGAVSILACEPEVRFRGGRDSLRRALDWLEPRPGRDRFERLLIGSLSYELGAEFESRVPRPAPGLPPPVDLAGYRAACVWEPGSAGGRVVGEDPAARARLRERLRAAATASAAGSPSPALGPARLSLGDAAYRAAVAAVLDWIRAGDVYQVNVSRRLTLPAPDRAGLRALYARLTAHAGAPFSALLEGPDRALLSQSPERFLRVTGRRVESCPIKGTRPRGRTPTEDRWQAKALLDSGKDAAEHLMIVDLVRNDLGRVCEIGSVQVQELAGLQSFATVHHLVSSVQGDLRRGVDAEALLAACFPGGSITGAPKLRAMQIIDELEPVPRDVYTGAIGYLDAAGGLDLSIAIRTAVARGGELHLHAGGGIVADSEPAAELREAEDKLRAFREAWGL